MTNEIDFEAIATKMVCDYLRHGRNEISEAYLVGLITGALEEVANHYKSKQVIDWPSEEIMAHKGIPEMECYTQESIRGFFACYRWLKSRVKPGAVKRLSHDEIYEKADAYAEAQEKDFCLIQHYVDGLRDGFEEGYRSAEKDHGIEGE
jgi:hypothetical protein